LSESIALCIEILNEIIAANNSLEATWDAARFAGDEADYWGGNSWRAE
jgi:hypothetical protein